MVPVSFQPDSAPVLEFWKKMYGFLDTVPAARATTYCAGMVPTTAVPLVVPLLFMYQTVIVLPEEFVGSLWKSRSGTPSLSISADPNSVLPLGMVIDPPPDGATVTVEETCTLVIIHMVTAPELMS